jgi:hypothetical protein
MTGRAFRSSSPSLGISESRCRRGSVPPRRRPQLFTVDVRPAGIDLTDLSLPVEETFFRMLRYREFDAAEMSLSAYVLSLLGDDDPPFIAIPAFPSRAFRHSAIYVRADSDIAEPALW